MPANWQYHLEAGFSDDLLRERSAAALLQIATSTNDQRSALIADLRPLHADYFKNLAPQDAPYFAGHYRGEPYLHLRPYGVRFGQNHGAHPTVVGAMMNALAHEANRLFATYESNVVDAPHLTPAKKLYRLAEISAGLFVAFLTIHPFADGNGHMSRMLIHLCFAQYGHKIRMPVHPRPIPPLANLDVLIEEFRKGRAAPLTFYLLSTI